MAKGVAPPKNTGGGGFVFEDKVCSWFLAHMLLQQAPLDQGLGQLVRIDFQTAPDGWFLDDLLLTLLSNGTTHRCAISIKSNIQFGDCKAPAEFVNLTWKQFLKIDSSTFNCDKDYLTLATSPLPSELKTDLDFVLNTARVGDPTLLPTRYATDKWASGCRDALFRSFACPAEFAGPRGIDTHDIGRLLQRLRFLQFDFESTVSESEKQGIERCQAALRSGSFDGARQLWNTLLSISAERRPLAGFIDRPTLLQILRGKFQLLELPDHRVDWTRLHNLTSNSLGRISDSIGGSVRMPRPSVQETLAKALDVSRTVVLLGPSGTGKSAAAKCFAERRLREGHICLWFDAASFERPDFAALQADLRLSSSLPEVLTSVADESPLLVVDGLDRVYDSGSLTIASALLLALDLPQEHSAWQVLLTCQNPEWARLETSLRQANLSALGWRIVECPPPSPGELETVWNTIPQAAPLKYRSELQPILTNLKILDLIATRLATDGQLSDSTWAGESDIADWYWQSYVDAGPHRYPQANFATLLAERQADELRPSIPLSAFGVSDTAALDGLQKAGVCVLSESGRVSFAHDLLGDWARLRLLMQHSDDLHGYLGNRLSSPLWHKAVRLYGLRLLENARDLDQWRKLIREESETIQDLMLEALLFAANPPPLLQTVCDDLGNDEGRLLRRLLKRFLIVATLPDPRVLARARSLGIETAAVAAEYRVPNWIYWPPLLHFLHRYQAKFVPLAPEELARVAELWMTCTPPGVPLRREAAELGLTLGDHARRAWLEGRGWSDDQRVYRVALAGAHEFPDEVCALALRASERTDEGYVGDERSGITHPLLGLLAREPIHPWPQGPRRRMDDDFRKVVLERDSLVPLIQTCPQVAREVVLATLIQEPNPWASKREKRDNLGFHYRMGEFNPPLYNDGPFLLFLSINFEQGLQTIAEMVDFATERWRADAESDALEFASRQHYEGMVATLMKDWMRPPGTALLPLEVGFRTIVGDDRVYLWPAGEGRVPPDELQAALMALEKHLYDEIKKGAPVEDKLRAILDRTQSVAFLKILCDVGKLKPSFFTGPLRSLLAMPEIYRWDIEAVVRGRRSQMFGAFRRGNVFLEQAQAFHSLAHRSADLRDIATYLFLIHSEVRDYLDGFRIGWEKLLAENPEHSERDFIANLIERFTYDNYVWEDDGSVAINRKAQERANETEALLEEFVRRNLHLRCRQLLNEGKPLSEDTLEQLWNQAQSVAQMSVEFTPSHDVPHEDSRENTADRGRSSFLAPLLRLIRRALRSIVSLFRSSNPPRIETELEHEELAEAPSDEALEQQQLMASITAGVAAVLLRLSGDWLQRYPERRQWCIQQLLLRPSSGREGPFDSPWDCSWECFAAEALPGLWAESANSDLRFAIAWLALAPHTVVLRILFAQCAANRSTLRPDFDRLRRLAFEFAHVWPRIDALRGLQQYNKISDSDSRRFEKAIDIWAAEHMTAFAEGRLPEPATNWADMDPSDRFADFDEHCFQLGARPELDFRIVRAAHEWLPTLDHALDKAERQWMTEFLHSALLFTLGQASPDKRSYPDEDERWLLDLIAANLTLMTASEQPEALWNPILDLATGAEGWPEVFLRAFHRHGLTQDPVHPMFPALRRQMIERLLNGDSASANDFEPTSGDVWQSLIGIDQFSAERWKPSHASLTQESADLLERWSALCLKHDRHLARFARWVAQEAADPIRLRSLVWIQHALEGKVARIDDRRGAADSLARLLHVMWEKEETRVRGSAEIFAAFKSILRRLVDQQNPAAMELTGRIGRHPAA